jgi:hypothetical protein
MNLEFDFDKIEVTEFGVELDDRDGQSCFIVQVDADAQSALLDIAEYTRQAMNELTNTPSKYDPSEKYASSEYVYLPLNDPLAKQVRELHKADNLPIDMGGVSDPTKVFCYFARMTDSNDQRLTALKRANQFKGVLKNRNRMMRVLSDALTLIKEPVFKLDNDFDLLIDASNVHILHPSGFEFIGQLREAVLAAVPRNIEALKQDLDFVDFAGIQEYAGEHPRAARHLASIRAQNETKDIDRAYLKKLCTDTGVEILESDEKITVQKGHVMGFLEVLDRRRYQIELVNGSPERFKAPSRQKIER